jgi:NADH-quinone oxidoreductase subunit N
MPGRSWHCWSCGCYFDKPQDDAPVTVGGAAQTMLALNGMAMLVLGLFPTLLFGLMQL